MNKKQIFIWALGVLALLLVVSATSAFGGFCPPAPDCKNSDTYCYPLGSSVDLMCKSAAQPGQDLRAGFRIDEGSKDVLVACEGFTAEVNVLACKALNPENLKGATKASPKLIEVLWGYIKAK